MTTTNSTSNKNNKSTCPYHDPILQLIPPKPSATQGTSAMARFLAEGPSEQASLFIRADTGKSSIDKGCTCGQKIKKGHSSENGARDA